jgi:tetratricopeptide (TPR) repeat protein
VGGARGGGNFADTEKKRENIKVRRLIAILFLAFVPCIRSNFLGTPTCAYAQDASQGAKEGASDKEKIQKEMDSLKETNKNMKQYLVNVSNLNSRLEDQAKMLYIKSLEVQDMKNQLSNTREIIDGLNKERIDLKKKNEALQEKIDSLEETLKNERAGFYQELGGAYAGSGNFKKAIEAYNRSLHYAPDNTRAYYYLGLLYKHHLDDSQKAVDNFKNYLKYNPEAKDKEEVEYFINMMSN